METISVKDLLIQIRDLLETKQIGVQYVVAPMVETAYALSKYIAAKDVVYSADEAQDTDFLFNMETITAYENRAPIVELAAGRPGAGSAPSRLSQPSIRI